MVHEFRGTNFWDTLYMTEYKLARRGNPAFVLIGYRGRWAHLSLSGFPA